MTDVKSKARGSTDAIQMEMLLDLQKEIIGLGGVLSLFLDADNTVGQICARSPYLTCEDIQGLQNYVQTDGTYGVDMFKFTLLIATGIDCLGKSDEGSEANFAQFSVLTKCKDVIRVHKNVRLMMIAANNGRTQMYGMTHDSPVLVTGIYSEQIIWILPRDDKVPNPMFNFYFTAGEVASSHGEGSNSRLKRGQDLRRNVPQQTIMKLFGIGEKQARESREKIAKALVHGDLYSRHVLDHLTEVVRKMAFEYKVEITSETCATVTSISDEAKSYTVCIDPVHCTCGPFTSEGLPCPHAAAAATRFNLSIFSDRFVPFQWRFESHYQYVPALQRAYLAPPPSTLATAAGITKLCALNISKVLLAITVPQTKNKHSIFFDALRHSTSGTFLQDDRSFLLT
ncbi:hypothetical protein HDU98_001419 [Podochytrium sp. JEL0797]|nr:hypothetical protein HDU98_001419 [Podochytrium sp. JEL0797]